MFVNTSGECVETTFFRYIVYRLLISYIYVHGQSLVTILQRAEVLLQFLTMGEAKAVAEDYYIVRREWLTVILVHQGCNAAFVEVVVRIDHVEVVVLPVGFVIAKHYLLGILSQAVSVSNKPCAKNSLQAEVINF